MHYSISFTQTDTAGNIYVVYDTGYTGCETIIIIS